MRLFFEVAYKLLCEFWIARSVNKTDSRSDYNNLFMMIIFIIIYFANQKGGFDQVNNYLM